jgi:hypothetical protein
MSDQNILIEGRVTYDNSASPVQNATVNLYRREAGGQAPEQQPIAHAIAYARTNPNGDFEIRASVDPENKYFVRCTAFGVPTNEHDLPIDAGRQDYKALLDMQLDLKVTFLHYSVTHGEAIHDTYGVVGRPIIARLDGGNIGSTRWHENSAAQITRTGNGEAVVVPLQPGRLRIAVTATEKDGHAAAMVHGEVAVAEEVGTIGVRGNIGVHGDIGGHIRVTMERTDSRRTPDEALWSAIDERCEAIGFERYQAHIRRVFELPNMGAFQGEISRKLGELGARGVGAYRVLREVTELFVLLGCGPLADRKLSPGDAIANDFSPQLTQSRMEIEEGLRQYLHNGELPYIERVISAAYPWLDLDGSGLDGLRRRMFRQPLFLELWHEMCLEHGMVMRTMDAVCARFQNIYNSGENDGLASYEISPLWPLGDLLWDWINHEPTRLNPMRRIQEYQHQYGQTVLGRDAIGFRAADVRTAFPRAFLNLLNLCEEFYKEDSQTTVIADAFPTLVALREVHQILAMGSGNAAQPLGFAARVETLMMQLMLAQPELRAFLHVREMVPYDEAWMGQVDAMKDLQGWQDQSISHYRDLAVYGERILLSIRLADWTAGHEDNAKNWLRVHKNAIRRFAHAHRAISAAELAPSNRRPTARAGLVSDGRAGMLRGRQQARSELGFAKSLGQVTPQLTSRGRLVE